MATMRPKKNPITKIIGNVGKAAVKAAKKPATTKKLVTKQIAAEKKWAVEEYGQLATHPGAASVKSNRRLTKQNKWSTDKQIKRYQKQEAKEIVKGNARGLKAANKPTKASKNPEIKASKKIGDAGVALKNRSRGQANWEGQMTVDALRKSNPKKYKALMKESKKK